MNEFSSNWDLKRHTESLHEGKRWDQDQCSANFSDRRTVLSHKRIVHEKCVKHHCVVCDKSFNTLGYLKAHQQNVHEEKKKYECELCKKIINGKLALDKHMRRVHSEKKAQV